MKGKLIKTDDEYRLYLDDVLPYATSDNSLYKRLSKQNCDEIFGVIDIDDLAYKHRRVYQDSFEGMNECIMKDAMHQQVGFVAGFNKAMEFNKYTEEDIMKAYDFGSNALLGVSKNNLIQSLQQLKEIEVEIVMDRIPADLAPGGWDVFPKLDDQGCIILKKVL